MTLGHTFDKKRKRIPAIKGLVMCYMTVFLTVLFFKNTSATAMWVSRGLSMCVTRLIPSLFPFMVVSSLFVCFCADAPLLRVLSKPVGALLGISTCGTSALIAGWLCGFPVGAKCACDLFRDGKINRSEYNTLLCITGTPSPAFLIGTVGTSMLGDTRQGVLLYSLSVCISAVMGIFLHLITKKQPLAVANRNSDNNIPFSRALTRAVTESGIGMLNICAFVVFFSAFLGTLEGILVPLGLPPIYIAGVFGFFELTSGLSKLASLSGSLVLPMCGLICGWSGLSVHFQTMSICKQPTRFAPYLLAHAIKGILFFTVLLLFHN